MSIQSYRDLRVWQESMTLAEAIYRLTKAYPKDETYGLTAQMRRASVSVPANIAEGYGRENTGSYVQFLRIAQGSLKELETHLLLSARVALALMDDVEPLLTQTETVGKMLRALIRSLESGSKQ
ncbi:MAG: four helix bundle protein [Hyphomicrobiales bacterium]|nr:four helix bundle protein [Hyphomicrobiales bacterium]OQW83397.1 MAG: hypothetical protein BVN31_05900 [Proteobacteria bacterium ST_bin15]